jgi:hypothetical protein
MPKAAVSTPKSFFLFVFHSLYHWDSALVRLPRSGSSSAHPSSSRQMGSFLALAFHSHFVFSLPPPPRSIRLVSCFFRSCNFSVALQMSIDPTLTTQIMTGVTTRRGSRCEVSPIMDSISVNQGWNLRTQSPSSFAMLGSHDESARFPP